MGIWEPFALGGWIYKFRVDGHPERVRRIEDLHHGVGIVEVKRSIGVLAAVPQSDWVIRRRS